MEDADGEETFISIHAPPRGATTVSVYDSPRGAISIHAPPRGATKLIGEDPGDTVFQFTPLREGRRTSNVSGVTVLDISIHAPPRGATRRRQSFRLALLISIHAPPRGATASDYPPFGCLSHFNSRPSARGDAEMTESCTQSINFNSRPSARGDKPFSLPPVSPRYFNSRPSARGDHMVFAIPRFAILFQFTPLREGRQGGCTRNHLFQGISIHAPPRGATGVDLTLMHFDRISIHSPPRGATLQGQRFFPASQGFQFTPLREGRLLAATVCVACAYFNSRPSARGDLHERRQTARKCVFQFTPLREGRRLRNQRLTVPPRISIHAPPRGATSRRKGILSR